MHFQKLSAVAGVLFALTWCVADEPKETKPNPAERIRADVAYLASDRLEGRGPGTRGEELGYRNFDLLRSDSLQKLNCEFYRQMNPKRGKDYVLTTVKLTFQTSVSDIRRIIKNANVSEEYTVVNLNFRRKNVDAVYGLKIEPNRIKFE